jgi:hypothetical protein
MPTDGQLSARDVILEIVNNMREGIEPLLYASLAPGIYQVFLHPDDYERLAPIAPRVVAEARRALDEEVQRLNGGDRLTPALVRRWLGRSPAIERPQDEWVIQLQPDPDGELKPGHLAVTSELSLPPRPQLDGTETRRVTTVRRGEQSTTSRQTVEAPAAVAPRAASATLRYTDEDGPHTFAIEKDRIVLGRGGVGYWVDVKLRAAPDVSREHLRIRRDPQSGGFFVKDLSTFGTTLDGAALPKSLEVVEGGKRDLEIEVPLPDRARLVLAGLVVIDFERAGAPR